MPHHVPASDILVSDRLAATGRHTEGKALVLPVIAIVGAGPGLGLSIARRFGREGFAVALISRSQSRVDDMAANLAGSGIEAAGFAADVLDRPALTAALTAVAQRLGAIDVLEYSPAPHDPAPALATVDVLHVRAEDVQPQVEFYVYGAITAAPPVRSRSLSPPTSTLARTRQRRARSTPTTTSTCAPRNQAGAASWSAGPRWTPAPPGRGRS
jgi:NAD(P)-dependent dehydrogenase (short-subunit alcohol dehydrogenase family)